MPTIALFATFVFATFAPFAHATSMAGFSVSEPQLTYNPDSLHLAFEVTNDSPAAKAGILLDLYCTLENGKAEALPIVITSATARDTGETFAHTYNATLHQVEAPFQPRRAIAIQMQIPTAKPVAAGSCTTLSFRGMWDN